MVSEGILKKPWVRHTALIISAVLTALSLNFGSLFFLTWFSLSPFIFIMLEELKKGTRARRMWLYGFEWAFCYYFIIYRWFTKLYPMEFLGATKIEAIGIIALCWTGLSCLQALGRAFLPAVLRLTCYKRPPFLTILLFACCWTAFEWLQSFTWVGVPWARLSVSQAPALPIIQSSSLFGSLFISFLIVLVNGLLALAFSAFLEGGVRARKVRIYASLALCVFSLNLIFGGLAMALKKSDSSRHITAALIQGNISSAEKWSQSSEDPLELYVNMSYEAAKDNDLDMIVWPETVINYYLRGSTYAISEISALAMNTGAVIYVGTFDREYRENGEFDEYNAIVAFYPDGSTDETPYFKRHLVPFGEYIPMRDFISAFIPALATFNIFGSDLAFGTGAAVEDGPGGRVGRLVCFDSIYPELARDSAKSGAEMLILSTNDSWYLDSPAVYQHNYHAVLRSVENGRWTLRAANTGISSIISPEGRVTDMLDPLTKGYIVGSACFESERTLYSYIGDSFAFLCALAVIFAAIFRAADIIRSKKRGG